MVPYTAFSGNFLFSFLSQSQKLLQQEGKSPSFVFFITFQHTAGFGTKKRIKNCQPTLKLPAQAAYLYAENLHEICTKTA